MKQFFVLLKTDLINGFALNKNFSRNKRNRKAHKSSSLAGVIILVVAMLIMAITYSVMFAEMAKPFNKLELVLAFGMSTGTLMTLFMTFANAYGTLFKSRDYELLASLPIKTSKIVASKIAALTIIGYAYFGVMYIPSSVVYALYASTGILFVFSALIVFLLGPLLITSLCSGIAFLFGTIISRFKNKNTITTILYVIFSVVLVVAVYSFSFTMPKTDNDDAMLNYVNNLYKTLTGLYPVSIIAIKAMLGNFLYLLLYIGCMLVPYIVFVYIIGSKYNYINTHSSNAYKNQNFDINSQKNYENKGVMKTLLSKETKTLLSIPVYMTNIIIGPIMTMGMMIAISYIVGFKPEILFGQLEEAIDPIFGVNILCAICLFLGGIAPASAVAISIEGKRFWIVKSLPIDAKKYLRTKLLFSYLIMGPLALIGSIVSVIILDINVIDIICIILIPQVSSLFYSIIGLLFNLKYYNLEWDNPTQAVKQGANMVLPMLIDFAVFVLALVIMIIGISFMISISWMILLLISVLLGIFIPIYRKHSEKMFNKIPA